MAIPTDEEIQSLVEAVQFNLNFTGALFKVADIQTALRLSLYDANIATARILESIATQKAMTGKKVQLGNVTIDNSIEDLREMAKYFRGKAGGERGGIPPLVSVHTDGTVGDGRSEFNKIGIDGVEEGERTDDNMKPRCGDNEEI